MVLPADTAVDRSTEHDGGVVVPVMSQVEPVVLPFTTRLRDQCFPDPGAAVALQDNSRAVRAGTGTATVISDVAFALPVGTASAVFGPRKRLNPWAGALTFVKTSMPRPTSVHVN